MEKKEDLLPEQKKEFLGIILKECDRIKRLINQVLEVEKIDAEVGALGESSSIDSTVRLALSRLQPQIEEKNIDLSYQSSDHTIMVNLAEDKMLQVMLNLLSNALKFCDAHAGIIRVTLYRNNAENATYLKVYNNGQYISEEYHTKIFEKFTQVKDGNLAKPEGSGLGLYITRKFVEQAGGKVSFISSEKEGTTFILQFP